MYRYYALEVYLDNLVILLLLFVLHILTTDLTAYYLHTLFHEWERDCFTRNPVAVPQIQIYFMLQFIQLPKIHLKKLFDKAIMKKLNLNICVYPAHCYHHLSHPQPMLKSSFATLMVFHKLNEINYFHILQTLHRVHGSPVSLHVYN